MKAALHYESSLSQIYSMDTINNYTVFQQMAAMCITKKRVQKAKSK